MNIDWCDMGADIHAYIEFYSEEDYVRNPSLCYVHCFSHGELDFGRNYTLFGLLAGVRSMNGPVYSVRGIPDTPPLSYTCSNEYYITVVDAEPKIQDYYQNFMHPRRWVTREKAEKLVHENSCGYGRKLEYKDASKKELQDPSYHSATHLTVDELCLIRKHYLLEVIEFQSELNRKNKKQLFDFISSKNEIELLNFSFPPHECPIFYSTIKAMKALENSSTTLKTRFVCWFDS